MNHLTPQERAALAVELSISEQYLYQCLSGRRQMGTEEAVDIERRSAGRLRRWQLCSRRWHLRWPELIGSDGAPPVPAQLTEEVSHGG